MSATSATEGPSVAAAADTLARWLEARSGEPAARLQPVAVQMLRRAQQMNPADEPGCLTRFDTLRVITRKWLARHLPAAAWRDPVTRHGARRLAVATAEALTDNRDTALPSDL